MSQIYEVSATPCTESDTERAPSSGVAETLLHETAGRESTLWRFDHTTCAGAGWNCPTCRGRNASSTTAQRVLDGMAERTGQTFGDNVLRIAEVNRRRS